MFFRNLTTFRFSKTTARSLTDLYDALSSHRLRSCGPLEMATRGFASPYGADSDVLLYTDTRFTWLTLGGEDKLLPAAVINAELGKRLHQETMRRGRPPGGRQRRAMRAEILDALLPQAFVRPMRLNAYLDVSDGWLAVDSASPAASETLLTMLRQALGSFPVVPLAPEIPPRARLTEWLASGNLPDGLWLCAECQLRDPVGGATIICREQELNSGEVREHLKQGKQVFRLGLQFGDRVSFVLGEDLVIRKLRFLDVMEDALDRADYHSAHAEVQARFTLMTRELSELLLSFERWFGLERPA